MEGPMDKAQILGVYAPRVVEVSVEIGRAHV
jgi:hypothetical protein